MNPIRLLAVLAVAALGWTGAAFAASAGTITLAPSADCTSNANLSVSWTGAGNHWEYGVARDAAGAVIGTFGPDASANDAWNGTYLVPITTAQGPDSRIISYAWIGANTPTPATTIEFAVVYNCSTHAVLYSCSGPYGSCATTVTAALAVPPGPAPAPPVWPARQVPATSPEILLVLAVLLALIGGRSLRRARARRP